jgi:hypothetical protein
MRVRSIGSRDAKSHVLATVPASPHSEYFRSLLSDPQFQIFYHAPVLILISASTQDPWIIEDCAPAAENLMLAAYAAGLGWIGFVNGPISSWEYGSRTNHELQALFARDFASRSRRRFDFSFT